jgi:pyruvate/2-oxoglutarate dehydrogenase complex dihydrolipoamide acyltransferase (E2) component
MSEVRVPLDLWAEDEQGGSSVVWLYPDGAPVRQGDLIAEILVDKATFELHAPACGTLRISVEPDAEIDRGQLVAMIV